MLQTPAPSFSLAEAEALAVDRFGIEGAAKQLTSERDQNFYLRTRDGAEFVLKIANASEALETIAAQNAVLRHLESIDPTLPAPHVVETREGAGHLRVRGHLVRVLTFRSGRLLHQVERTPLLRRSLGSTHAKLSTALASFPHELPAGDLLWDLMRANQLRPLLDHAPRDRAGLLEGVLDEFERQALPWLQRAPAQVIHNDLNPHNVVVDDEGVVSGVIDFGDMVRAPRICDVAVAAAYHVRHDSAPLADARQYVDAFCASCPLSEGDLALLPRLVAMRLAMTVLITNWRAALYPDNRTYILRNEPAAWRGAVALMEAGDRP